MKSEQIFLEIKLNLKHQIRTTFENIDLMIDFLYYGCFDEIVESLK